MNKASTYLKYCIVVLIFLTTTTPSVAQPDGIKIAQARVFSGSFQKNLYKAELLAMNHVISGIVFIKKTGETYRAVFLSEIGLKYFDIEIGKTGQGDYFVHYMVEMLNRKALSSFIEETFRMLTLTLGKSKKENKFTCRGSGNAVKIVKTQHGKFRYDYQQNNGYISTMIHNRFLRKNLTVILSNYGFRAPALITADQKNIQLHLKQIEN